MKKIVEGLVNGGRSDSIFDVNPFGWLGVKVELEFPLKDGRTLEDEFLKAAQKKIKFMKLGKVRSVKIVDDNSESTK